MTGASSPHPPCKILIVDDNSMGLMARRSVLRELGHDVVTSSAPLDALELCATKRFDIIITDYKMPKLNGVELITRVRKLDPEVSVILISGFTDTLGLNEANTGADVVLQKSNNEVTHLIRAVNRLLRKPAPRKPANVQEIAKPAKRKRSV
jgi:CheY-like chemotaxis protein